MSNLLKSWKTTTIGIVAIGGLAFNAYTNGGFSVQDFLALAFGVGFLLAKDSDKSHSLKAKSRISEGHIGGRPKDER